MSSRQKRSRQPAALGLRALKGGGVVVGVALEGREPRVVLSTFLPTGAADDRLSREPYHVAAEKGRGPDGRASPEAIAAVTEGRGRQEALAATGLDHISHTLQEAGYRVAVAALLANRAGWVTDLLEYSLAYPDHPPVAEGLAVRDALQQARAGRGMGVTAVDEKSLPGLAAEQLQLSAAQIDSHLKALGTAAGRPWRKEQKLACLAAWHALRLREATP